MVNWLTLQIAWIILNAWKFLDYKCALTGLVHKNDMSATRVENPSEIVDVGEQVWIKVIGREVKHNIEHK